MRKSRPQPNPGAGGCIGLVAMAWRDPAWRIDHRCRYHPRRSSRSDLRSMPGRPSRRRRRLRRSSSGGRALPLQDRARQAGHWCPSDPPPDWLASAPARSAPRSTSAAWRWDHGRHHRHPCVRLPGHSDRPSRAAHRDHRAGSPRPDRADRQAAQRAPAGPGHSGGITRRPQTDDNVSRADLGPKVPSIRP
jgi:hypothetical protein